MTMRELSISDKQTWIVKQKNILVSATIEDLEKMGGDSLLSGDDSGLKSTWEEICVQVQQEETVFWDNYITTIEILLLAKIEDLSLSERQLLWLSTEAGSEWRDENENDCSEDNVSPVFADDIVEELKSNLLSIAGEYKNSRITKYINAEVDEKSVVEQSDWGMTPEKQALLDALPPLSSEEASEHKALGKSLAQELCDSINSHKKEHVDEIKVISLKEIYSAPPPEKTILDVQRLNSAIEVAAKAHKDQFRKRTDIPYISHPYAVGMLLAQAGCSEDVIIAGILHDTVEDTPLTLDDIRKQFGDNIAEIVAGCSEHDKELEWKVRKQHTIDHLALATKGVKLVTCADKLHNVTCMLTDYAMYGETLWCRFNEGPYEQEWYFQSLADSLASGKIKSHPLVEIFTAAVKELFVVQRAKYKNIEQTSLSVGDDIDDDYCGWSSVWEPDKSEDFFCNFLISRECADCENTEDCEDYDEEDPCGCSDIDLEAAVDHLRGIAPHVLWKIDTNGYDDYTEGTWQWSTITVPDRQVPVAESIIEQIQKGEAITAFQNVEDFYPYLYDEKKRLRQEISDLFKFTAGLRHFVYGGYKDHLSNCDSKEDAPIKYLIKLLGNIFGAGKKLADISVDADWPDGPDDDYFLSPFSTALWGAYADYAMKFAASPDDKNPFEMVVRICDDLRHVLDHFKGEGPQQIAEAVRYWQFEFSCSAGSGEIIRGVLMHLHDILENIQQGGRHGKML